MKKIILLGILVLVFLISGCGENLTISGGLKSGEQLCNIPYFEYKTGECCLDSNDNKICDNDEETKEENKKEYQPVQALTVESCTDSSYFDCIWSYITKDEVQIKLRGKKAGKTIIEKIDMSNIPCSKEFTGDDLLPENGIRFGEVRQFNIKCDFKKDSVESDLEIYANFYPREGFRDEEKMDEWLEIKEPALGIVTKSWISGMVR